MLHRGSKCKKRWHQAEGQYSTQGANTGRCQLEFPAISQISGQRDKGLNQPLLRDLVTHLYGPLCISDRLRVDGQLLGDKPKIAAPPTKASLWLGCVTSVGSCCLALSHRITQQRSH